MHRHCSSYSRLSSTFFDVLTSPVCWPFSLTCFPCRVNHCNASTFPMPSMVYHPRELHHMQQACVKAFIQDDDLGISGWLPGKGSRRTQARGLNQPPHRGSGWSATERAAPTGAPGHLLSRAAETATGSLLAPSGHSRGSRDCPTEGQLMDHLTAYTSEVLPVLRSSHHLR